MLLLIWNLKRLFDSLLDQTINGMLVWILDLLGLLYNSAADRKGLLADAVLSATCTVFNCHAQEHYCI